MDDPRARASEDDSFLDHEGLKAATDRARIVWAGDTAEATGRARKKLREKAREWTDLAISTLANMCVTGSDMAKVASARELLDRGYGKAKELIEVDDKRETVTVAMVRDAVREMAKDPEQRALLRAAARGPN